ncbi:alpha/beta hydrolase family protein [Thalassotalea agarivorans]|uniref:Dipeptidyl aminopeptidase/acylaminoacyl peptidase n=1 Tax=Thalassotalea agarivorans TaxID=349064 RepID=A0A1I0AQF1_THASX|nr:prolyl oligopeptidase family serine peptidase [Thalassotalea agarivorans]SES96408.1 Dipeptidyl aminopeptidase/acylaminoacyl peptidase [Thalassotalea agarivorans]
MFKKWIYAMLLFCTLPAIAQDALQYQKPSKEILDLVDVTMAPATFVDDAQENMVLLFRSNYKSIDELSKEEMRLAGLRIDPKTNIGSRVTYYNDLKIQRVGSDKAITVKGMPEKPRLSNFSWSPNQLYLAFTHTTSTQVELWVLDIKAVSATRLTDKAVNANMGDAINWQADSKSLLVKMLPDDRKPLIDSSNAVPTGPTISVSDGKKAQNRTYQDLLKDKNDEFNFEQLARSALYTVSLDKNVAPWLPAGMYGNVSVSPAGDYVMVQQFQRPFSYLVPYRRFPHKIDVYTNKVKHAFTAADVPLIEDLPQGFMAVRTGPRRIQWRSDKPNTLVYAEALDGGDPEKEANYRDHVMQIAAPFKAKPKLLLKTHGRIYSFIWKDDSTAIAMDYWWNTRNTKTYLFSPNQAEAAKIISDRNYQDRYNDPGSFVTTKNEYFRDVLATDNGNAFMLGDGFTAKGQFPFLDKMDLQSLEKTRVYQSTYTDKYEAINDFNLKNNRLLVRIESKSEYPNYYFRNLENNELKALTSFTNPFVSLQNVKKEVITYKREDGLDLTGTVYLPVDYKKGKKYPMILWAYPEEFKDKSSAGQNTQNPNRFIFPWYGSPIYWVTKGYVVLDDASFPIVGEGDEEPNDTFRKQLISNAKAAIDALDQRNLIDRERVAVGGHSYGAFMVANLLSHSDLFAAGIARSGAYNRTLTPFGFQSEERHYWDAPEVYYNMSPFMHADKMKTPLLLIHGEADNNSGTYPMQSERYFNALKGLGAITRLVMLPKESHGYRAKESVLHTLWEQDQWLEKYVKNKGK